MQYKAAKQEDAERVYSLVQDTIKAIYPKYYPAEVVDFFCELHNYKNILNDIIYQNLGILIDNDTLVGTGCCQDNHITRVYVLPKYQGMGYGSYIIQSLEYEISRKYDKVVLDASLPASHFYESRGYKTTEHCRHIVNNGVVLVYEVMEKSF